jgi:hypothetical protein
MVASIDYAELEAQAAEIFRMETTIITNWQRSWTNEARKEIQRQYNFPEMLKFYPIESKIGTTFQTSTSTRRVEAPDRFKELAGDKDGLFLIEDGESTLLPERRYEWLVNEYKFSDTGEPEYLQIVRDEDGETVYFDIWPKPDAVYDLRVHGYFFLDNYGGGQDLSNVRDFLIERAALALRDALLREAYLAHEMRDMTLFAAQASKVRADGVISEAKNRVVTDVSSIVPSLDAKRDSGDRSDWGYPWWGKK